MMKPPFTLSTKILNQLVTVAERLGKMQFDYERNLHMRKNNRLQSIQASLAIENNSLTLEQVTDIINGKLVLGAPKEIQEVKNAYDAYEQIPNLSPYSVDDFLNTHRLMTQTLVDEAGQFRRGDVGVFDGKGNVIHMGARPDFVPRLVSDLFDWGRADDTPALIKSCVMHYEIEVIHPFSDGNGRMGRLWQTLVLASNNPLFAWLPIETMVYENQAGYYQALGQADSDNDSGVFIEFMLSIIADTLQTLEKQKKMSDKRPKVSDKMSDKLSETERKAYRRVASYLEHREYLNNKEATELLGKSPATVRRYLQKMVALGLLVSVGERKTRFYTLSDK